MATKSSKKTTFISLVLMMFLLIPILSVNAVAGTGVSTSSTGNSNTSQHSTVSNIANAYDGDNATYTRLDASGDWGISTCTHNSFAEVLYTLTLNSSTNQTILMSSFSRTVHSIQTGWSNVPDLKMYANVTDNSGTFNAWNSNVTNNSLSASPREIILGPVTPRANSTIDVNVRLQHNGTFSSSCDAEMYIYEFSTSTSPNISFTGSPFLFTKNTIITDLVPINSGGAITSWSITSGSLPSGLVFNTTTGIISGTPNAVTGSSLITIEATNPAGSDSATISISVQDEAPSISFTGSPFLFTKNTTITDLVPTNAGGAITSWSITSGSLPSGLVFNTTTGIISGTPNAVTGSSSITIEATNPAGSDSATISISVQDEAPSITYTGSPFLFTKNTTITDLVPINSGGAVTSWSITSGSLPSGLVFNTTTGIISGTPNAVTGSTSITIEATNPAGSDSATISISVQDEAPNISFTGSPFLFTKNTTITDLVPINSGGAVTSWSITSGSLPSGLVFNTTTGVISGTPNAVTGSSSITIEATNPAGSDSATISISVQDEAPSISYTGSPFLYTKNTTITDLVPINSGGAITSWSITSGSLPSGLVFNTTTGIISGTPDAVTGSSSITIEATNPAGSDSATISISVQDEAPSISFTGSPFLFTKNTTITDLVPMNSGGAITSWSITSGSLPSGLVFNTTTGIISGTPNAVTGSSSITIEATNPAGSDSATISISVQDEAPSISYTGSPFLYTKNTTITDLVPINSGGAITSWSITSGSLPSGLVFNTTTGIIFGTPNAVTGTSSVTIEATNPAGSDSATISISVQDEAPSISFTGSPFLFTKNTTITDLVPINAGGAITSWSITSGSLPSGLVFNTTTGIISGTPNAVTGSSSITIEATNPAGSDSATISISVQDEAPSISYTGSPFLYTKNTTITDLVPVNSGGAITSWSITSGSLPSGLVFNTTTGIISGTPNAVTGISSITIEATNPAGSDSATISISVQDESPFFEYPKSVYLFEYGNEIEQIIPQSIIGESVSWSISENLPLGLIFNESTGIISGNSSDEFESLNLSINLTNKRGTYSKYIEISVIKPPEATISIANYSFLLGEEIEEIMPISNSNFGQWSVTSGALPQGLVLNPETGIISGTPTSVNQLSSLTLTQSNSMGNSSVVIETTIRTYFVINLDNSTEFTDNSFNYMEDSSNPLSDGCDLQGERNSIYRCLTDGGSEINNSVIAVSVTNVYNQIILVIPEGNPDVVTPEFSSEVIDDPVTPNQEESDNGEITWMGILGMFFIAGLIFAALYSLIKWDIKKRKLLRRIHQEIEDNEPIENRDEVYVFSENFESAFSAEDLWEQRFFESLMLSLKLSNKSLGNRLSKNIDATKNKISQLPDDIINYYNKIGKQQPTLYAIRGSRKFSTTVLQLGELYVFIGLIEGSPDSISKEDRTWENILKMGAFPKTTLPDRFEFESSLFNQDSEIEFDIKSPIIEANTDEINHEKEEATVETRTPVREEPKMAVKNDLTSNEDNFTEIVLVQNRVSMMVNESAKRCKLRFTVKDENNRLEWIKFYRRMFRFEKKPKENISNILWHNILLKNEPEEVENGYEIELLYDRVIETNQKSSGDDSLYKKLHKKSKSFIIPSLETKILEEIVPNKDEPGITWTYIEKIYGNNLKNMLVEFWEFDTRIDNEYDDLLDPYFVPTLSYLLQALGHEPKQEPDSYKELKKDKGLIKEIRTTFERISSEIKIDNSNGTYPMTGCVRMHGDLRADNILASRANDLYLCDFSDYVWVDHKENVGRMEYYDGDKKRVSNSAFKNVSDVPSPNWITDISKFVASVILKLPYESAHRMNDKVRAPKRKQIRDILNANFVERMTYDITKSSSWVTDELKDMYADEDSFSKDYIRFMYLLALFDRLIQITIYWKNNPRIIPSADEWKERVIQICEAISNSVKPVEPSNENPKGKRQIKIKETQNLSVSIKSSGKSVVAIGDGAIASGGDVIKSSDTTITQKSSPKPVIPKVTQIMFYNTDRFQQQLLKEAEILNYLRKFIDVALSSIIKNSKEYVTTSNFKIYKLKYSTFSVYYALVLNKENSYTMYVISMGSVEEKFAVHQKQIQGFSHQLSPKSLMELNQALEAKCVRLEELVTVGFIRCKACDAENSLSDQVCNECGKNLRK